MVTVCSNDIVTVLGWCEEAVILGAVCRRATAKMQCAGCCSQQKSLFEAGEYLEHDNPESKRDNGIWVNDGSLFTGNMRL